MDGTENQKDTSQIGDTSGGDKGTSEQAPETFTRELRDKAVSDALSSAGRDAKSLEAIRTKLEKATEALTQERTQWRKDKHDAELDAAGDDKDAVSRVRARHEHSETKSELAKVKQELDTEREKSKEASVQAEEIDRTVRAAEIAAKHDVDLSALIKFTDGSPEAMEELAKALPKKGGSTPVKLDSGKNTGSGKDLSGMSSRQAFGSYLAEKK